ncbi:MAG TPA: competence/damage-inducible protein A [Acidobacteriota bacterium]|nr:competence/damage-inducible protein A [Acidobacteriota bacterium]
MKAEIIAIGSELLTPDHLDTNSLILTGRLNDAGFEVRVKTIVGDRVDDIAGVLRIALQRSDVIILCGGLGPTEDDLTRTAVAQVLGRPIFVDPDIVESLRRRFARRGYSMPAINERQAQIIQGAEILANPHGSAPGMWLVEQGIGVALLPGPPRELEAMFEAGVLPHVKSLGGGRRQAKVAINVTGMTESEVDSLVAPIYKAYPSVQTTILASVGHIALRLSRWLESGEQPQDLNEVANRIRAALGDAVFSSAGETLEAVVGGLLRKSGRTLAVAESCTSGMLAARVTSVPGSSDYFLGGVLCYSNEAKIRLCRVPEEMLAQHGAVSPEVAEALAHGTRENLKSSIGLSITGVAGPGGGSAEKPVGLVFVGWADETCTTHWRRMIPGDRETIRERAAYFALSRLRAFLM